MNEYFQQGKYSSFELKELLKAYQKATDSYFISSITDLEGFIIYANPSFCEISQYSSTELIGKTHKIMSANHHSADFFKGMWDTISAGEEWKGELKNKAKDGKEFWLNTTIIPIKNSEGAVQQYISINSNITEQKNASAKKTKNFNDLEILLHMISHEVRKPITNLLGITNMYSKIPPDPQETVILLNYIKQNSLELDAFTRKLTMHIYELSLDEKKELEIN